MELAWTAHPAKRRPRDVALVVAVLCLTLAAVAFSFQSLFLTALSGIIVLASIASFLFPTRYRISESGIASSRLWRTRQRRWQDLRRVQIGRDAALLSPFASANWLDRFRGLIVLFDGSDRDRVIDLLRTRVSAANDTGAIATEGAP